MGVPSTQCWSQVAGADQGGDMNRVTLGQSLSLLLALFWQVLSCNDRVYWATTGCSGLAVAVSNPHHSKWCCLFICVLQGRDLIPLVHCGILWALSSDGHMLGSWFLLGEWILPGIDRSLFNFFRWGNTISENASSLVSCNLQWGLYETVAWLLSSVPWHVEGGCDDLVKQMWKCVRD